jgi:ATP-dependent helicase YprA (DUF1998 family)
MNPLAVANHLRARYVSYLTTTFGVNDAYRQMHNRFADMLLAPRQLLAGPFLEGTPPYQPGAATLAALVREGLLHRGFEALFAKPATDPAPGRAGGFGRKPAAAASTPARERMAGDRLLYHHQEEALRRLCAAPADFDRNRHTVVASGTGSGKTECFLLPALDWVFRHPSRAGGRGLRVLLVYPMNALVNDQIRRLRQLVGFRAKDGEAPVPVTFARYTSETQSTRAAGLERDPAAPDNQLLGRDEIVADPPDILITNFAMLEQAMLRPQETPFFARVDEHAWRFLILDEAHSYRGAQAIELARLMQRVRAAVRRGKAAAGVPVREPVCIATSATLASGGLTPDERRARTAEFAGSLFGVPFAPDNVLFADRLDPTAGEPCFAFPDPGAEAAADAAWATLPAAALDDLGRAPDDAFRAALEPLAPADVGEAADRAAGGDRRAYLFHLLRRHPRFHWLWQQVRGAPARFEDLVRAAGWAGELDADRSVTLERLISACNAARRLPGEQALLPCRYHLFASALEGLFADLATDAERARPDPDWDDPDVGVRVLSLRRRQPADRRVVELGRCLGCGYPLVVIDPDAREVGLDQPPVWDRPVDVYAFRPDRVDGPPLTEAAVDLALPGEARMARTLYAVPPSADRTDAGSCPNCGRPSRHYTVVGRFLTGQDAPVSVLTEALYEQLPPLSEARRRQLAASHPHRFRPGSDPVVGGGRKLLMFSDSRQNAAFMASYLQDHSTEYLIRELAFDALARAPGGPRSLGDWAHQTLDRAAELGVQVPFLQDRDLADLDGSPFCGSYLTEPAACLRQIRARLLADVQGTQPLSLEAVGLAEVTVDPSGIDVLSGDPEATVEGTPDWPGGPIRLGELRDLIDRTCRLVRRQYLVTAPPGVGRPGFSEVQQWLILERAREMPEAVHGLLSAAAQDTVFLDLLRRWGRRRGGSDPTDSQLRAIAAWLFEGLASLDSVFVEAAQSGVRALALRHEAVRVGPVRALFRCDRCDSVVGSFLAGVCPEPRCRGALATVPPDRLPSAVPDEHMFAGRYVNGPRCELRSEEHTAQLSAELGQDVQEAFQAGQVNVLSCSTTFEMGIDLGDLQSIVLRNMPPGPANYIQRAGRAGRRADAVAFVLTFCQRRPHDRTFFQRPERIIAGEVRPPRIDLGNEKILRRHVFAEVLAEYWQWLNRQSVGGKRDRFRMSGDVGLFAAELIDDVQQPPAVYLRTWLADPAWRATCVRRLREAFPELDADDKAAAHLDVLADPDPNGANPLARAVCEAGQLLDSFRDGIESHQGQADDLNQAIAEAGRNRAPAADVDGLRRREREERELVYSFQRLDRQARREFLISFLMGRGVLPSFAFPVNVVTLHVLAREMEFDNSRLKLERDGKVGLGDYAPGSQVVAGKHVYQSAGLRKFPALQFDFLDWFRWCRTCNGLELWEGAERVTDAKPECPRCGHPLPAPDRNPRQWTQPRWGYVTDRSEKAKPPRGQRPYRTFTTRAFFLGGRPGEGSDSERHPARPAECRVEAAAERGRSLLVLNLGEYASKDGVVSRTGFRVCSRCGRAKFDGRNTPKAHRPPYHKAGRSCSGPIGLGPNARNQPVALGHRYETDVVWLDFHGAGRDRTDAGFWLSLAYALTAAAGTELNIEPTDLEATTVPLADADRQAVVIYDSVPGGAGHSRQILRHLPDIVRRARDLLAACDCDPASTGCYGCLCTYQNQFAHAQLSRGPALEFLNRLVDQFDRDDPDPWRREQPAPAREMADALAAAVGPVTLVAPAIRPGLIPGLNRDWFDLLKEAAARPSVGPRLTVVLGAAPGTGTPGEALARQRLAEIQALGASVRVAAAPLTASVLDADRGPAGAVVWRWDEGLPLGPDLRAARRSRVGREAAARADVGPAPAGGPVRFEPLRGFRHFAMHPGVPQDPLAPDHLGPVFSGPVRRLLVIDPFTLHNHREKCELECFLARLRAAPGAQTIVKAGLADGRGSNYSEPAQRQAARAIETQAARLGVRVVFPRGRLVEHDRIMLAEVLDGSLPRYYRILLGQGLIGFSHTCARYSEGVWFEMEAVEFLADWDRLAR